MKKPFNELIKLNTKNLLRLYKAERKRFYAAGYWCSCGCGEKLWVARNSRLDMKQLYIKHKAYLNLVKTELDKREHIS